MFKLTLTVEGGVDWNSTEVDPNSLDELIGLLFFYWPDAKIRIDRKTVTQDDSDS